MTFHSSLLAYPIKYKPFRHSRGSSVWLQKTTWKKSQEFSLICTCTHQAGDGFPILGLWLCGACLYAELTLWSFVSYIQIYRANKWVAALTHLCRYIWVSGFSFGCFIVPHSSLAISEWASEPFLYNELNSVSMANPRVSPTPVLTLWEHQRKNFRGGSRRSERDACAANAKQCTENSVTVIPN